MHRFFFSPEGIPGDTVVITEKQTLHHIRDVLRLKAKEKAVLVDGAGTEYLAELSEAGAEKAVFSVIRKQAANKEKAVLVTVACAIPKKSKIDDVIDKLTQIGIDRIIPLVSERVIVKLDKKTADNRLARWQKIAQAASQQSQRSTVPAIDPLIDIKQLIAKSEGFDLKLIPHLAGGRRPLKSVLKGVRPKSVLVLIGPEGDFTPAEVDQALRAGFIPVSFGDFVLRVETAAVYIASILTYTAA